MKTLLPFAIVLILGTPFLSCTPQEISNINQNTPSQIVSTGDDDDIGPDNDKDED